MINAQSIKEHMEVCGSDGAHVGTVDYLEGETTIKLTKSDRNREASTTSFRSTGSTRSTTRCA
jgi:hypothetical protein